MVKRDTYKSIIYCVTCGKVAGFTHEEYISPVVQCVVCKLGVYSGGVLSHE